MSLKPALSSFPDTGKGLGVFCKVLGREGHPESILLLPLFKDCWSQKDPFLLHFLFKLHSQSRLSMADSWQGGSAVLPSSAINCRSQSDAQIVKTGTVCPPLAWLSSVCVPLSYASPLRAAKLIQPHPFPLSLWLWCLLETTPLLGDACTLSMNKDTGILYAGSQLHPNKGPLFQDCFGVCGLPCHIRWVMKGYRKQPEICYWRHVIIADLKGACQFCFLCYYLCYDNCIWIFTFQPYPISYKLKGRMYQQDF